MGRACRASARNRVFWYRKQGLSNRFPSALSVHVSVLSTVRSRKRRSPRARDERSQTGPSPSQSSKPSRRCIVLYVVKLHLHGWQQLTILLPLANRATSSFSLHGMLHAPDTIPPSPSSPNPFPGSSLRQCASVQATRSRVHVAAGRCTQCCTLFCRPDVSHDFEDT